MLVEDKNNWFWANLKRVRQYGSSQKVRIFSIITFKVILLQSEVNSLKLIYAYTRNLWIENAENI